MRKKTPLTPEARETIARLVREDLAQRFSDDEFIFDPIEVMPGDHYYHDPEDTKECVEVFIVFDGDQKNLDAKWTGGMNVRLWPKLEEAGYPYLLIRRFLTKETWKRRGAQHLKQEPWNRKRKGARYFRGRS